MIDSHAHLRENIDDIIYRAKEAGVEKIMSVACSFDDIDALKHILAVYPNDVVGAFGLHPENVNEFNEQNVRDIFKSCPQLIAYGEIGLDYFYGTDNHDEQCQVFKAQIKLAYELKKPLIIHTRDAEEDTINILQQANQQGYLKYGGVVHCFTGSEQLAKSAIDMGLYISASGIITFKKSDELRSVFESVPLDKLLVETDAPFLAPTPYRGKTNEPAYVAYTLNKLAEIKNIDVVQLECITTQNFKNLFESRVHDY